jgi:NADH:ubiquinone oxidoreductase subunit E
MITRAVGWIEREAMSPVADRAQREPLSVREVLTRFVRFFVFRDAGARRCMRQR